ncbi:MAG TPA: hypothetical protein VLA16_07340 [Ideonella sp.]|nr:hypothetical protein [Ideonella sp.]
MQYVELQRSAFLAHVADIERNRYVDDTLIGEWVRLGWLEPEAIQPRRWRVTPTGARLQREYRLRDAA